jgi:hypothetical protein
MAYLDEHGLATFKGKIDEQLGDLKSAMAAKLPAPPTTDGTYVLTVTVTAGDPAYSWVSTGT